MTAIFGWQDDDDVFLIGDTVVTRSGAPYGSMSSFGEATIEDGITVEEGAIKIVELPRGVVVGVAGDAILASTYLEVLATDLRKSTKPVLQILHDLGPVFRRDTLEIELLIGHPIENGVALTRIATTQPFVSEAKRGVTILGSLPNDKKAAAARVVSRIRDHGLPPEARLAAALVHLQAGGILDYLLVHGVGGTLFGARANLHGVHWQPDLMYFVYASGDFANTPIVADNSSRPEGLKNSRLGLVRVLVRQGSGIVLSSLGNPRGRMFIPPGRRLTEQEWQSIALEAVPPPFELIAPVRHYGFLSTTFRKAASLALLENIANARSLSVMGDVGRREVRIVPRLVESLEQSVPTNCFDFLIVTENERGVSGTGYRLDEAAIG